MATLADSYTNLAGLQAALRDAVGHPDQTVLLPDRTVNNALQAALDEFNADRPLLSVASFSTVIGQQAYNPLPSAAYGFRRVYWLGSCEGREPEWQLLVQTLNPFFGTSETLEGLPVDELGTRLPIEPARVMALLRQEAWLRKLSGKGASIIEKTVYLDPIPRKVETVIFTWHGPRFTTALAVADQYRKPFLALVEGKLHQRLATGAGAVSDVKDANEGTSIITLAPAHHLKRAGECRVEYKASLPPPLPPNAFP